MASMNCAVSVLVAVFVGLGCIGCAQQLPRYPVMSVEESITVVAERFEGVRTISARCDVTARDSKGEDVRLDGAVAIEFPGRMRLRAWKFNQAVLDITIDDEDAWVWMREREGEAALGSGEWLPAGQFAAALRVLSPSWFAAAAADDARTSDATLTLVGPALEPDAPAVVCTIDRPTLTPRRFTLDGREDVAITLDQYEVYGEVVWPRRMRISGAEGELTIRLYQTEFNQEHAEGAFVPPRRAKLLP